MSIVAVGAPVAEMRRGMVSDTDVVLQSLSNDKMNCFPIFRSTSYSYLKAAFSWTVAAKDLTADSQRTTLKQRIRNIQLSAMFCNLFYTILFILYPI